MKKRGIKVMALGLSASIFLTGCGSSFPEMSEDEYNQTVQYAVGLLMKYSNNGVEKLSTLSAFELQRQIEKEERAKRKAERDAQNAAATGASNITEEEDVAKAEEEPVAEDTDVTQEQTEKEETDIVETNPEETKPEEETEEKTEENTEENTSEDGEKEEPSDDKVTVDVSSEDGKEDDDIDKLLDEYGDALDKGKEQAEKTDEEEPEEETSSDDKTKEEDKTSEGPEELSGDTDKTVDGLRQELSKGIFLTYSGYSIAASYPDDDDIFVINAEKGKKLLILNFRISNTTDADMTVDMEKANPHFQIKLNGKNVGYTNVTWLDNDLSTFKGTIKAGDKVSMVLVKQMDEGKVKNIESLGLIGDLGSETITFNLE